MIINIKFKLAFSMIELVFVIIIIIGILSAIAIPKLSVTRDDAIISKGLSEVASIRSAISTERQKRILKGDFTNIVASYINGLLQYGLSQYWSGLTFSGGGKTCSFTLNDNKFIRLSGCTLPTI